MSSQAETNTQEELLDSTLAHDNLFNRDDNDAQAQYTDDGMGSPVRQFAPRGRSLKTKTESADAPKRAPKVKAAPKTASKIPAKENAHKKRKTTADESTSSVKVSKRAKTMAAEGAAKASVKTAAAATKVPKGAHVSQSLPHVQPQPPH